jgi:hypothetical protein
MKKSLLLTISLFVGLNAITLPVYANIGDTIKKYRTPIAKIAAAVSLGTVAVLVLKDVSKNLDIINQSLQQISLISLNNPTAEEAIGAYATGILLKNWMMYEAFKGFYGGFLAITGTTIFINGISNAVEIKTQNQ